MPDFAPIFTEDENSVLARMFGDVDEGWAQVSTRALDKREGSAIWLLLMGVAKEMARGYSAMNDVAELAFVQFLEGDFLTDKAMEYGLTRLSEEPANGLVTFYGTAATVIPLGAEVTNTVQFDEDAVYEYETQAASTITSQAAPLTAPIVSNGGIGPLSGSYSYRFTFVEVDDDGQPVAETAHGPASGNFTALNMAMLVGGFPVIPSNHRLRIYRTTSSGSTSGVWKLVAELSDPASTTYTDQFADGQLGSYNIWTGDAGSEFVPLRTAGPIVSSEDPSAYVMVLASEEGEAANLPAGDINLLRDGIPGVSSVMNPRDFTTGRDLEPDEVFLPKVLERIQKPQGAGTQQDYIDWLLEVPGISFVTVNPHFDGVIDRPGYVHCVVRDENNDPIPNDILVIAREGGVVSGKDIEGLDPSPTGSGKGRAPIGPKVILQTVRKDIMRVTATVKAKDGYALVPATGQINLQVLIDGSLSLLIDNLPPGATVYEAAVLDAVYTTEGVEDVVMNLPTAADFAMDVLEYDDVLDAWVASTVAAQDANGNWTLGKTQVLEYDNVNSTFAEV